MSALQRSALSARIAKLPQVPPGIAPTVAPYARHDEDDDEEEKEIDGLGALPNTATQTIQYINRLGFTLHPLTFTNFS